MYYLAGIALYRFLNGSFVDSSVAPPLEPERLFQRVPWQVLNGNGDVLKAGFSRLQRRVPIAEAFRGDLCQRRPGQGVCRRCHGGDLGSDFWLFSIVSSLAVRQCKSKRFLAFDVPTSDGQALKRLAGVEVAAPPGTPMGAHGKCA
jgi:hypothetical protein